MRQADVALTTCTSEGIAQTIGGLGARSHGDEILTSDEEHPGLLGALAAARELRGVAIREVPLPSIAEAVGPRTRLIACSHVGWVSGLLAPAELAEVDVPVLLDGAQGVGAVEVDVRALGCDAYAGGRAEVAVRPRRHGHAVREPLACASAWRCQGAAIPTSPTPTPGWTPGCTRTRAALTRCR